MLVTRFAPSPTGHLHLGSVYSAQFAWRLAREAGGRFLVRMEDIDQTRCKPEYADSILDDLAWLGLDWDGEVRVQSEHFDDYSEAMAKLVRRDLVYPCFCTRAEIAADIEAAGGAPQGPDGPIYPGTCQYLGCQEIRRHIAADRDPAFRIDMTRAVALTGRLTFHDHGRGQIACQPLHCGDVVVDRKDGKASYHLAATVDDAIQAVTLVTRGEDLLPSTDIHRVLQTLLDLPEPEYWHHGLLLGPDGKRLAKRNKSVSVPDLRAAGHSPAEILAMAEALAPAART